MILNGCVFLVAIDTAGILAFISNKQTGLNGTLVSVHFPPCLPSERRFDVQTSLEKTGAIFFLSHHASASN